MSKHLVAVYGSLRIGGGNDRLLENSKYIRKVVLSGFAMYDGGSFPYTKYTGNKDDKIIAEIYEVDNNVFRQLDMLEGISSNNDDTGHYKRVLIGNSGIWVYISNENRNLKKVPFVSELYPNNEKAKNFNFSDWILYSKNKKSSYYSTYNSNNYYPEKPLNKTEIYAILDSSYTMPDLESIYDYSYSSDDKKYDEWLDYFVELMVEGNYTENDVYDALDELLNDVDEIKDKNNTDTTPRSGELFDILDGLDDILLKILEVVADREGHRLDLESYKEIIVDKAISKNMTDEQVIDYVNELYNKTKSSSDDSTLVDNDIEKYEKLKGHYSSLYNKFMNIIPSADITSAYENLKDKMQNLSPDSGVKSGDVLWFIQKVIDNRFSGKIKLESSEYSDIYKGVKSYLNDNIQSTLEFLIENKNEPISAMKIMVESI